jgi:SAM-dependent methyltransferase
MNTYAEAKTEVIERILAAARESGSSSSPGRCSAMVNAYREDLASIHDAGFGRFAREAAALLLRELRPSTMERGLVIDLGCGSGILAEQLANGGFDVLGIDLSASLITLARNRVPGGQFRVESLLTAQLPRCIAIAAVGECVNYLFDDRHSLEGVRQVLGRAFAALVPGGLLVFDVAEPGRVPDGASKTFTEGEDWAVLVAAEEDLQHEFVTRHITTFRRAGELYRRDHEIHRLRLLPRKQVLSWLQDIGFRVEILNAYGTTRFPTRYVGFLARKPQ